MSWRSVPLPGRGRWRPSSETWPRWRGRCGPDGWRRPGGIRCAVVVAALLEDDAPAVLVTHAVAPAGLGAPAAQSPGRGRRAGGAAARGRGNRPGDRRAQPGACPRGRCGGGHSPEGIARLDGLPPTRPAAAPEPVPDVGPRWAGHDRLHVGHHRTAEGSRPDAPQPLASADAWAAVLAPRPGDRWLACLPLFHVAGLAIVLRASRWRVPLEVLPRFDADEVVERIEARHQPPVARAHAARSAAGRVAPSTRCRRPCVPSCWGAPHPGVEPGRRPRARACPC